MPGWRLILSMFSLLLLMAAGSVSAADDSPPWQDRLETVRNLADQGRYFHARAELQALQTDYPQLGVLDLDAAVIELALGEYTAARASIDRVLEREDLPEAVRINALLLAETIDQREASRGSPQWRAEGGVQGGLTMQAQQPWVGASLWVQRDAPLQTLDLAGYPTPIRARGSLNLNWRHYFDVDAADEVYDPTSYRLEGRGGLVGRWRPWTLETAAGYRLRHSGHGPLISGGVILALADSLDLFTQHETHWRTDAGSADQLWRLGVRLLPSTHWQAEAAYLRSHPSHLDSPWQVVRARVQHALSTPQRGLPESLAVGVTVPVTDALASGTADAHLRWAAEGWRPGLDARLQIPLEAATPGGELGLYWRY